MNVVQTEFGQNVSFDMRTFRFITPGSSATDAQNQTISCDLHLEPANEVASAQPDDCSCHTEADCATQRSYDAVLMLSTSRPNNVPMVIGTNGKQHLIAFLFGVAILLDSCGI